MTAEELKIRLVKPDKYSMTQFEPFYQITPKELEELNKSYHKSKVEATKYKCTDDLRSAYNGKQISKCVMHTDVGYDYFTDDYVLWLEEQLLKQ